MTTLSISSRLALAAIAAALLAPVTNAQAEGNGRMAFGVTTGTAKPVFAADHSRSSLSPSNGAATAPVLVLRGTEGVHVNVVKAETQTTTNKD